VGTHRSDNRNMLPDLAPDLHLVQDTSARMAVVTVAVTPFGTMCGVVLPNNRVEHAHVVRSTRKDRCSLLAAHAKRYTT